MPAGCCGRYWSDKMRTSCKYHGEGSDGTVRSKDQSIAEQRIYWTKGRSGLGVTLWLVMCGKCIGPWTRGTSSAVKFAVGAISRLQELKRWWVVLAWKALYALYDRSRSRRVASMRTSRVYEPLATYVKVVDIQEWGPDCGSYVLSKWMTSTAYSADSDLGVHSTKFLSLAKFHTKYQSKNTCEQKIVCYIAVLISLCK